MIYSSSSSCHAVVDDESTSSLMDTHIVKKEPLHNRTSSLQLRQRTVRFCEEANQEYPNTQWRQQETRKLWYKPSDYHKFCLNDKQRASDYRKIANHEASNPTNWTRCLWHLYMCFQRANGMDDIQQALEQYGLADDCFTRRPHLVGLDSKVITPMELDRRQRRASMQRQICRLQCRQSFLCEQDRVDAIRLTSLRYSHGAALYARYLAHASVGMA